jgi:hypothetical protein
MLKECSMMKNYMTTGALAKGKKPRDDAAGKATAPLPGEKAVMSIYGGPVVTPTFCKNKNFVQIGVHIKL